MYGACNSNFFDPPPGALGRDQKVKYHLISTTKSISKNLIPNFVCVIQNITDRILICCLGHALGVGLGGV